MMEPGKHRACGMKTARLPIGSKMNTLFSLEGKSALVTGAGRGMGQAIAIAFAQAGADVAIASRTESELTNTAEAIMKSGTPGKRVVSIPTDLSEPGSTAALVETVISKLKNLDILVTLVRDDCAQTCAGDRRRRLESSH